MRFQVPKPREQEIANLTQALAFFVSRAGGRVVRTENGTQGPVCFVLVDGNGMRAYLTFKRDWLHSYARLFPQEGGEGWGQTLNLKLLERAAADGAYVVVVTPDRTIYALEAKEWLDYARSHGTIRQPSTETADEASVPARLLHRVPASYQQA